MWNNNDPEVAIHQHAVPNAELAEERDEPNWNEIALMPYLDEAAYYYSYYYYLEIIKLIKLGLVYLFRDSKLVRYSPFLTSLIKQGIEFTEDELTLLVEFIDNCLDNNIYILNGSRVIANFLRVFTKEDLLNIDINRIQDLEGYTILGRANFRFDNIQRLEQNRIPFLQNWAQSNAQAFALFRQRFTVAEMNRLSLNRLVYCFLNVQNLPDTISVEFLEQLTPSTVALILSSRNPINPLLWQFPSIDLNRLNREIFHILMPFLDLASPEELPSTIVFLDSLGLEKISLITNMLPKLTHFLQKFTRENLFSLPLDKLRVLLTHADNYLFAQLTQDELETIESNILSIFFENDLSIDRFLPGDLSITSLVKLGAEKLSFIIKFPEAQHILMQKYTTEELELMSIDRIKDELAYLDPEKLEKEKQTKFLLTPEFLIGAFNKNILLEAKLSRYIIENRLNLDDQKKLKRILKNSTSNPVSNYYLALIKFTEIVFSKDTNLADLEVFLTNLNNAISSRPDLSKFLLKKVIESSKFIPIRQQAIELLHKTKEEQSKFSALKA